MKKIGLTLLLVMSSMSVSAGEMRSCLSQTCQAGVKGVTYATTSDPFYACPMPELTEYLSTVNGLLSMHQALGLPPAPVSRTTGEPTYFDDKNGPNETRLVIEEKRTAAGVKSVFEAKKMCELGRPGVFVTVVTPARKGGIALKVIEVKSKKTYWMTRGHVDVLP